MFEGKIIEMDEEVLGLLLRAFRGIRSIGIDGEFRAVNGAGSRCDQEFGCEHQQAV